MSNLWKYMYMSVILEALEGSFLTGILRILKDDVWQKDSLETLFYINQNNNKDVLYSTIYKSIKLFLGQTHLQKKRH